MKKWRWYEMISNFYIILSQILENNNDFSLIVFHVFCSVISYLSFMIWNINVLTEWKLYENVKYCEKFMILLYIN